MKNIKTIIFDLDGTLIHSAPDIQAAINRTFDQLGRKSLDQSQVISFIGNGVEKLVARALAATGGANSDVEQDALKLFLSEYEADPFSLTKPYSGVPERLAQFAAQGFKLGVCTNKPTDAAQKICDALDLTKFFEVIAGAETNRPKKPDPTPLFDVIDALGGLAAEALYVGDSLVDQAAARNAEVPFAFFSGGYLNGELESPAPAFTFDDWSADWPSHL